VVVFSLFFFFSSRRRHTRCYRDWSSDVCSSDLSGSSRTAHIVGGDLRGNCVCSATAVSIREIELEGIVLADVWRKPAVFKAVVEDAKPATGNEFGANLIREADSRRKIRLLRVAESSTINIRSDA